MRSPTVGGRNKKRSSNKWQAYRWQTHRSVINDTGCLSSNSDGSTDLRITMERIDLLKRLATADLYKYQVIPAELPRVDKPTSNQALTEDQEQPMRNRIHEVTHKHKRNTWDSGPSAIAKSHRMNRNGMTTNYEYPANTMGLPATCIDQSNPN